MPRPLARLVTVPLVVALAGVVLLLPGSARACACGAAYVPGGHTVRAGDELAFLGWARPGRERLEMALSLTADTADLAVLVPTPAPPQVSQGDPETFDRLSILTTPPPSSTGGSDGDGNGAAAPQAAPSVLSTTTLDDVVATVIEGGTPAGVTRWLARHGYAQKPRVTPAIADYLRDGWVFTAIKLRADRPFDGTVDPIVLTFASKELVYPMRLSSTADEVGTVTVYTLDRTYDARTDPAAPGTLGTVATATVEPDSFSGGPLHDLPAAGYTRVTKFVYPGLAPSSLTADFTYAADPDAHADPQPGDQPGDQPGATRDLDGSGGVPPWAIGLIVFAAALLVGGVGLAIGLRRGSAR